MKKFIGFLIQSGEFVSKDTGEVIAWSNCYIRCTTDEDLEKGEYGLKIVEQKLKTSFVIKSLKLSDNTSETGVVEALQRILNKNLNFTVGLVKGKYEINGFTVVS